MYNSNKSIKFRGTRKSLFSLYPGNNTYKYTLSGILRFHQTTCQSKYGRIRKGIKISKLCPQTKKWKNCFAVYFISCQGTGRLPNLTDQVERLHLAFK